DRTVGLADMAILAVILSVPASDLAHATDARFFADTLRITLARNLNRASLTGVSSALRAGRGFGGFELQICVSRVRAELLKRPPDGEKTRALRASRRKKPTQKWIAPALRVRSTKMAARARQHARARSHHQRRTPRLT